MRFFATRQTQGPEDTPRPAGDRDGFRAGLRHQQREGGKLGALAGRSRCDLRGDPVSALPQARPLAGLRSGWIKRIQQETAKREPWADRRGPGPRARKESASPVDAVPGIPKFLEEGLPKLQWNMEVDLYRNGDESGAAVRMLAHLEQIPQPSVRTRVGRSIQAAAQARRSAARAEGRRVARLVRAPRRAARQFTG